MKTKISLKEYNAWKARLAAERVAAAAQKLAEINSRRNSVSVPVPGSFQTAANARQQHSDPQFDQIEKDLRAMHEDTGSGNDNEVVVLSNNMVQRKKDDNRPTSISPLFPQGLLGGRGSNFGSLDDIISALDVNNHELTTYELIWGKAPSPVRAQFTPSPVSSSPPIRIFSRTPSPPELSPQKPLDLTTLLQDQFSPPAPTLHEEMSRLTQPIISPPLGMMVSPANVLPQKLKRKATGSASTRSSSPFPAASEILALLETEVGSEKSPNAPTNKEKYNDSLDVSFLDDSQSEPDISTSKPEEGQELYPQLKSQLMKAKREQNGHSSSLLSFSELTTTRGSDQQTKDSNWLPSFQSLNKRPSSSQSTFREFVGSDGNRRYLIDGENPFKGPSPKRDPSSSADSDSDSDTVTVYIQPAAPKKTRGPMLNRLMAAYKLQGQLNSSSESIPNKTTRFIDFLSTQRALYKNQVSSPQPINSAPQPAVPNSQVLPTPVENQSQQPSMPPSQPEQLLSNQMQQQTLRRTPVTSLSNTYGLGSTSQVGRPTVAVAPTPQLTSGRQSANLFQPQNAQLAQNPQLLHPSVSAGRELQSPGPNVMSQQPRGFPNEISSFLQSIHGGTPPMSATHSQSPTFKMPHPVNNYTRQKSIEEQTQSPQLTAAAAPPSSILRQSIMSPQRSRQSPYPAYPPSPSHLPDYPAERTVTPIPTTRATLTPISQGTRPPPQYQQQQLSPYYTYSHLPYPDGSRMVTSSPQIRYGLPAPPQYSGPSMSPLQKSSYMPMPTASASPLQRVRTPRTTRAAAGSRAPYGSRSTFQTPQSPLPSESPSNRPMSYSHNPYSYRQPIYPYYEMSPQSPRYPQAVPQPRGRSDTPYPLMSYQHPSSQSSMYDHHRQVSPVAPNQNAPSYPFRPSSAMDIRQMSRPSSVAEIRQISRPSSVAETRQMSRPSSTVPMLSSLNSRESEDVTYTTLQPPRPTRLASQPVPDQLVRNPSFGRPYPYQTNIPAHGPNNHNLLLNLKGSQHLGRARQSAHPYANTEKYGVGANGKGRSYTPTTPQQQQAPFFQTIQQQQQPPPYQQSPEGTSYGSNCGQQFYSEGKGQPQRPFSNLGAQSPRAPSSQLSGQNARTQYQQQPSYIQTPPNATRYNGVAAPNTQGVYSQSANYGGSSSQTNTSSTYYSTAGGGGGGPVGSRSTTAGHSGSAEGPGGGESQNSIRVGPGASSSGFALPIMDRGAGRPAISIQQNPSRRQQAIQFSGGQVHNKDYGSQQGGAQHLSNAAAGNLNHHYIGGVQYKTGRGAERLSGTYGRGRGGGDAFQQPNVSDTSATTTNSVESAQANPSRGGGADQASASPQEYTHQRQQVSHHGGALPLYPQPQFDANSRRLLNHTPSNENWQFENDAAVLPGNIQRTEEELWKRQESEAHQQSGSKTPTSNSGNVLGSPPFQPTPGSSTFQQSDTGAAQLSVPISHSANTSTNWTTATDHYGQPTAHSPASSHDRRLHTVSTPSSMVQTPPNQETVYGGHTPNRLSLNANNYQLSSVPGSGASSQASSPASPAFPAPNVHSHGPYVGGDTRDDPQPKIAEKVPKTKHDNRLYWDD